MKRIALLFLSSALRLSTHAAEPTPVKTGTLHRGDVLRYVNIPGTLRANQQTTLYAKVAGYVHRLSADTGDHVKAGQLLAELEVPELLADQRKFEADAKVAELELQRLTDARRKAPDLVLPQALDKARATSEMALASLERTRTLLRFAQITAPFDGIVTARYVDAGAFVPAAGTGSTPRTAAVFTVTDASTLRATAPVPELDAVFVQAGQPAKILVEVLAGKPLDAKVSRTAYGIDETTRTMQVEADLPNAELGLRPGLFATLRIGVERHTNALRIPADCVAMEKTNAFLFKIVEGKLRKTPVTLGFNDSVYAEVLSGVQEGETVAVVGKSTFADGQPVVAQPVEPTK
jgi:RND family efflux transporter MFP subunit